MILLSPHFTLQEFVRSDAAIRHGIDNAPTPEVLANLRVLADTLEAVRAILGRPLRISSGYRCPALNAAIRGSVTSAHMVGRAVDFECPSFGNPASVMKALAPHVRELNIDQLIEEFPPDGWVHLGIAQQGALPRNQLLTYSGGSYEKYIA